MGLCGGLEEGQEDAEACLCCHCSVRWLVCGLYCLNAIAQEVPQYEQEPAEASTSCKASPCTGNRSIALMRRGRPR